MCSHFEREAPYCHSTSKVQAEAAAEDIKTRSLGIQTLLLDSSGPSCIFCVWTTSPWLKNVFPERTESSGKMCSGHVNFLPNRNYSRFEALAWPRFYQFISLNIIDVVSQKIISIWSEYFIPNMKQWIDTNEKQRSKRFVSQISQFVKMFLLFYFLRRRK